MPKYQIIVHSNEDLFSQEFEDWVKETLVFEPRFKLLYAQSVQGIRKELWDKREELKDSNGTETRIEWDKTIEDTFKDIENLFNIGE